MKYKLSAIQCTDESQILFSVFAVEIREIRPPKSDKRDWLRPFSHVCNLQPPVGNLAMMTALKRLTWPAQGGKNAICWVKWFCNLQRDWLIPGGSQIDPCGGAIRNLQSGFSKWAVAIVIPKLTMVSKCARKLTVQVT